MFVVSNKNARKTSVPRVTFLTKLQSRSATLLKRDSDNDAVLVFLVLTITYFTHFSSDYIVYFKQVNISWDQYHPEAYSGPCQTSKMELTEIFLG